MKLRTLLLLLVLLAIAGFTLLNWAVIMSPTALSLGVAEIQAPLGLILLGLMSVLAVFGATFATRQHLRHFRAKTH